MAAFNYRPGGNPILQLIVGAGVLALCVGVFVAMLPVVLVIVGVIFVAALAYFLYLKFTGKLSPATGEGFSNGTTWTYTYVRTESDPVRESESEPQRIAAKPAFDASEVEDIEEVSPKKRRGAKK